MFWGEGEANLRRRSAKKNRADVLGKLTHIYVRIPHGDDVMLMNITLLLLILNLSVHKVAHTNGPVFFFFFSFLYIKDHNTKSNKNQKHVGCRKIVGIVKNIQ